MGGPSATLTRWADAAARNVRYGVRSLARTPAFTATVVATLALGIGANTAVFSGVDAILIRPLPFPEPDRLVRIRQTREGASAANVANVGPVRLEEWNAQSSTFVAMTGYATESMADTSGELPERIRFAGVAGRFHDVWGVAPMLGRGFVETDHVDGAAPVALISERYWRRRFDADPAIVGTVIGDENRSAEIIGVMPASFGFPERDVDLWSNNTLSGFALSRYSAWYTSHGRLAPGVTVAQARADLRAIQARLAEQYPESDREIGVDVEALKDATVGALRDSLWLVFGAVTVLLLIACTNIAALLLSRAAARRQAVAVRLALGSSRRSIAGQMLTESAILAVVGAALSVVVAAAVAAGLRKLAPSLPRIEEFALDASLLGYTFVSLVTVTLLCGVLPAARSTSAAEGGRISEAGRGEVAPRHSLQWWFVGVQVALSVALLFGAGLLVRSFQALSTEDTGFDPDGVLSFRITGSFAESYGSMVQSVERILDELVELPGIDAAAASSPVPGVLNDGSGFQFGAATYAIDGIDAGSPPIVAEIRVVSPSYFDTLQIPLVAGEPCRRGGAPLDGVNGVIVNQVFVTRYLEGRNPIGLTIRSANGSNPRRIAGVVGDAREFGLSRVPVPTTYRCDTVVTYPPLAFLVRTSGDPDAIVNTVRRKIAELEPDRSIYDVLPLRERLGKEYTTDRLRAMLVALFAAAALALVCLGIHGTLSYVVSLRRREVGLRVALGAMRKHVVSQFLSKALRVVSLACLAGLAFAFVVSRSLTSMLYGVSPSDPVTLAAVVGVVLAAATAAALVPAVRASRVDPMQTLREE